jgi:Tannase-like family of unknown function (DUF6351)
MTWAYTCGRSTRVGGALVILGAVLARFPLEIALAANDVRIRVVSSRADMVTGGDALVEITGASSAVPAIAVILNGRDVTNVFRAAGSNGSLLGRIEGLTIGRNVLEARTRGKRVVRLDLHNHPIAGPVFSGPHQTPFVCQTEEAGLGPALDYNCSAPTVVGYV